MTNKLQKPHIIYHMLTSLDGKVSGDFLNAPESKKLCNEYYRLHKEFKANAFLCGRKTMQDSFTGDELPNLSGYDLWHWDRNDYIAFPNAEFYAVAIDIHCKLNWQAAYITDEDPGYDNAFIREILCENAPDAYLAYLQSKNISYIFAGKERLDLHLAMHKLKTLFGIETLLLEGGGITGSKFVEEGLVDEYSLVVSPTFQGNSGVSLIHEELTNVQQAYLVEQCQLSKGVWLHFAKDVNNVVYRRTHTSPHDLIKRAIFDVCKSMGLDAKEEYRGNGWRADVYVEVDDMKYAFEIQATPQSLGKTQERQAKYIRDGITCCWLFEKETKNMKSEFQELPLFQFLQAPNGDFIVSLKGRKSLPLDEFVKDFLNHRIRFCQHIKRSPKLEVKFLKMDCWKCGAKNYIYHIWPLKSTCNAEINYQDNIWESNKFLFHPEIVNKVKEFLNSEQGKHLPMGEIKERYSRTVDKSYISFGCCKCDAIFGDLFVEEAILDSMCYKEDVVECLQIEVNSAETMAEYFPHWCHPGDLDFCE